MVKASHPRQAADSGAIRGPRFRGSPFRGIPDRSVDALCVVVLDVLAQQASQMILVEHDDVVEQLAADAPDEALGCPVLPGTSEGCARGFDSESSDRLSDQSRGDRVVVENQEAVGRLIREGVA